MKLRVYSVFDSKAAYYGTPFFSSTDGMAVRSFGDAVNDRMTTLFKHPEDFTLYRIGEFDDQLGRVLPTTPEPIVTAASLKLAVSDAVAHPFISKLDKLAEKSLEEVPS